MTGLKRTSLLLTGLAALTGFSFAARGAEKRVDVRKQRVERPLEDIVASAAPAVLPADNPKVAAGKVRWHADFETACAAARDSGKPVLLFQMMGNLDDRFC